MITSQDNCRKHGRDHKQSNLYGSFCVDETAVMFCLPQETAVKALACEVEERLMIGAVKRRADMIHDSLTWIAVERHAGVVEIAFIKRAVESLACEVRDVFII